MRVIAFATLLFLAACRDHRPPTPSAEQNAQLNDAENMLNAAADQDAQSNST